MENRKRKALFFTILVHLFIPFIPLPEKTHILIQEPNYESIEVKLTTPPPPPKKVVKKTPPKKVTPKKKKVVKKTPPKTVEKQPVVEKKPEPPKPTSLPGDRDKPHILTQRVPTTPKMAINNSWSGNVVVDVFIGKDGSIEKIELVKSSGYDILDTTFIRTIEAYFTFLPTRKMGEDKTDKIRLEHTFK